MSTTTRARDHWRGVLAAGDVTVVPRWTRHPAVGVAAHVTTIPRDLMTGARRLAVELGGSFGSVLLAAHAKVLSALSAEPEVTTGYVADRTGRPLPCRVATRQGTWRALVLEAGRAESALLSYRDFPVAELVRELGRTGPAFEVELDPWDSGGDLAPSTVLGVGVAQLSEPAVLRIRYRTDVLDADFAARLAGYHLAALAQLVADPAADGRRQSLLSAGELHLQVEGLAGPRRDLPDRRFHELFEQQATAHPDAVAATCGGRRWTYRELNDRANRLGRALIARGLRREGIVAVVAERSLDWMAAVLAVFKAGGVYLPVEPHFPPDRVAAMLGRAGCRLALTEPGSTAALDQALDSLPEVQTLLVDTAYAEDHPGGDLGVAVTADQLAYIYFTSGSTGEPKGAMCEHAGLLNHLSAKIHDLGIGEGDVVAQTAPQCFDISLWQLASALLVGGRALVVEQEVILDVERLVDTIVDGRVTVLQVVPSYLDAVLAYLEGHPRQLPDLRCVSVTGEALTTELARRWFAAFPGVTLVNAYGLTETSDDTNHEVMDRAPDRPRVPLGRPVNNVHVYVVDEHLSPVPLGAPGEIVFSGVCVGRGYVNDPERTRQAFPADPLRPGQRLYRSGDHGRWLPDGKLEFLGRRDAQVKLSGFRIEVGEVEGALARTPGVRQSAVVVAEPVGGRKRLVAFYSGRPLDADVLRGTLGASLPEYMIPSVFYWREGLPLTDNGKVDRAALRALAEQLDGAWEDVHAPRTPAEHRLASAWATVLGVQRDQIDRRDHFFERGGTSLSAVQLVVSLNRAVSLEDVTRYPVLADLARLVGSGEQRVKRAKGADMSSLPATPATSTMDVDLSTGRPPMIWAGSTDDARAWADEHREALRTIVVEHGSVLVRGLGLRDAAEVAAVFRRLGGELMTEREAFASRRRYADGVYSSSTWPSTQPMCMHHELSYRLEFPGLMLFACLTAPDSGGATAVADAPSVLDALPAELVARFQREGWLLTRTYADEIGASIADAFGTDDRGAVEAYCRAHGIEFEWRPDGGLQTRQRRSAVVRHPVSGRRCWFNQVAFLSKWTMDPDVREYLVDVYGADGLPFDTSFGNGDPIGADVVEVVNGVYEARTAREPWRAGDLMLVDNIRTAHSREAFEGSREVLVALADPVHLADCAPTGEVTR